MSRERGAVGQPTRYKRLHQSSKENLTERKLRNRDGVFGLPARFPLPDDDSSMSTTDEDELSQNESVSWDNDRPIETWLQLKDFRCPVTGCQGK